MEEEHPLEFLLSKKEKIRFAAELPVGQRERGRWAVLAYCPFFLGLFLDAEDKAVRSPETSVNFYRTTSHNITLFLTAHLIAV